MAKLKFGSPAWRKKYMNKNRGAEKSKPAKKRTNAYRSSKKRGLKAKKTRMKEMIKGNPPKGWIPASAVKVVKRNGRRVLLVRSPRRAR